MNKNNLSRVVVCSFACFGLVLRLYGADCVAPPEGLVGWWPGDGNANDIVGTNNGALLGGALATAQGVNGGAFSFDGTNGYVEIPDSPVFHLPVLTLECWVRFRSYQTPGNTPYTNQQYIVFKKNSRTFNFEGFTLTKDHDPQGDVFLWEVSSPAGGLTRIDSVSTIITSIWYHAVGVRGSNYVQIWKDGQMEYETNVNFPQDYGTLPLYFGTSGQSYYDHKMNGELDEVSLYNRPLSSNEIVALYQSGPMGKCKGTNGIVISSQPQSLVVAPGDGAVFTVTAAGVLPMTYQWQLDGTNLADATEATLTLTNVQPADAGSYAVVVSNITGQVRSDGADLGVFATPEMVGPALTTNGMFTFSMIGVPGATNVVDTSTNLIDWMPYLTNTSGIVDFAEPLETNDSARYFRGRISF